MTPTIDTLPATPDIAPLPTVDGGFQTVLADPPWRFANRTGKVAPEHRRLDRYGTMDLEAIKALPVGDVTAKDAHLYLWVPNALLLEGIEVLQAWGFRYVSNVIWAKRRKDGGPDGRGVGFYFRNVTEPILFGVKGSMRTLAPARSTVNMIETRKREHSRKPDEQYDLIESCSPGPYLEMFARYARPGWSAWGNESDDEVAPKGQTHKGYSGGAIETFPSLEPNQRLSPWLADRLSRILVEEYADGASIDQLAQESGYSIQRVRGLLEQGGVTLRGRGRPKKEEVPVKAARKTQRAAPGSRRGDENRGPGSKCRSTGSRAAPRALRDGGGRVRCPTARRPTVGCSRWPPRSGASDRSAAPPGRRPSWTGCPGARSSGSGTPRRRRPSAGTARRGA